MRVLTLMSLMLVLAGCGIPNTDSHRYTPGSTGSIDFARLAKADTEPDHWFTGGRDAGGTYFSPLTDINERNVARLGFAWQYDLGTSRGQEASPIVVDGVMFAVGNFGRVYALEAATGLQRWVFMPQLEMQRARYACCDAVNRGLAVWKGRVYVAALDGYLYSLDANTGRPIWKTDTLVGREQNIPYTSSGAPVITQDAVVVGNGGGDSPGVRGFVSAYDLQTGDLKWRFFTVPRDPTIGAQDQPHLLEAVKSWDAQHPWKAGAGGSVWDGLTYDAKTDLVFMGTGNGYPHNAHAMRNGSQTNGDELYACSVIAVHASDGSLAWYYQEVPSDQWDFDADEKFILATLPIDGTRREVLLHAPKNGFFYVFDRVTGKVLRASNFTFVNWTRGLDPETHRPIPNPAADYTRGPALVWPATYGAHSWQPMSFNPRTGLVYIPAMEMPNVMIDVSQQKQGGDDEFAVRGLLPGEYDPKTLSREGTLPSLESLRKHTPTGPITPQGTLIAWDPVREKAAWRIPGATWWDGGVMSTAGNLVFRGDAHGFLNVYTADTGKLVKTIDVGTSILAAPITYRVRGEQYIAFMAGYGGAGGFVFAPETAAYKYGNENRIVALKLSGTPVPKPPETPDVPFERPTTPRGSAERVQRGETLYRRFCARCHVFGRGLLPDLRRFSATGSEELFYQIVLNGAYQSLGMGRFDDALSRADTEAIRAYLLDRAWDAFQGGPAPSTASK